MRSHLAALAAGVWLASTAGTASRAAAQTEITITVHAVVQDSSGARVRNLARDDFEILTDGQPRPLAEFSAEEPPLSMVLLIDVSVSTIPRIPGAIESSFGPESVANAVESMTQRLRPGDRVRVGSTGAHVTIGQAFLTLPKQVADAAAAAIEAPPAERHGPSPVWDAIDAGVTALDKEPGRRGILILTDGRATGNRRSLAYAAQRASIGRTTVTAVSPPSTRVLRVTDKTAIRVEPGALLQRLADFTGGLFLPHTPEPGGTVDMLFERGLNDLRECYTLTFRVPPDGRLHALDVRVKKPGLVVRSRRVFLSE